MESRCGELEFDERGNQTGASYFGVDGKPCLNKEKVAGWKAAYDERGNEIGRAFFGVDGKPCLDIIRVAARQAVFDARGNETSMAYFGADGKPCLNLYGIAGWKAAFDERGNQASIAYIGVRGEPIIAPKLGYHRAVRRYDQNGKFLGEKYFDRQDKPLTSDQVRKATAKNMRAK